MTTQTPMPIISTSLLSDLLKDLVLDKDEYMSLLSKLIGESRHVQNNPRQGLVPCEAKVARHVLDVLKPYTTTTENNSSGGGGGPLLIQQFVYKEGRPNIKITYPGTNNGATTTSFIGSHMDVVPANPETWQRDPFALEFDGTDKLYGRGTTDCLGHVALITLLLKALAVRKPVLERSVVALFIAGEEGGETGVGIDMVVKDGALEECKNGICFWIDSADSQPCTGTAGVLQVRSFESLLFALSFFMLAVCSKKFADKFLLLSLSTSLFFNYQWHLKATGRLFHSGLPHRGINSLELVSEAMAVIQRRFYEDFPPHEQEELYKFATPSTMKPTQVECAKGALNQLPPWTTISGDIRLTPFYDPITVMNKVNEYVAELNQNMESIPTRGPCSKYTLQGGDDVDITRGTLEMKWGEDVAGILQMEGIACDLKSPGLQALIDATAQVKGEAKPYAITGSLPLVKQMQKQGFDIQITG
jgi:acetylornithine deacetylase